MEVMFDNGTEILNAYQRTTIIWKCKRLQKEK